ncbi:Cytochrome P450 superfamily protein [Abortiporus biennis]
MFDTTLTFLRTAILAFAAWVVWKIAHRFLVKSPLDNIPGPKSTSILTGNLSQMFDRHGWDFHREIGEKYGPIVKHNGILGQRVLYVFDPKAMHSIVIKDQYTFQPAKFFTESLRIGFGPGLLSVYGETHRRQRKMLNPVFSINHMRHMTPVFYAIAHKLRDAIALQVEGTAKDLDMLRWIGRTALELIGQGGLGYSFDSLTEDKPNAFGDALKNFLPTVFQVQLLRYHFHYFTKLGPASFRRRLVEIIPHPLIQKIKDIVDTMQLHSTKIFDGKKQALKAGDEAVVEQISQGKDVMSVLMKANMEASKEDKLPEEELLAQVTTLVFAATDTTTSALYPPISFVFRQAFEDGILPLSRPIHVVDGRPISEISVPKGTFIAVGVLASNRNEDIWGKDVLEWKPERWLSPLPEEVTAARIPGVYSNLMTFFGGGRACIGFKFSQLEMKVVLSTLLQSFKFSPADCAKNITWNLAGVKYPTIGKVDNHPSLPIKMELISPSP